MATQPNQVNVEEVRARVNQKNTELREEEVELLIQAAREDYQDNLMSPIWAMVNICLLYTSPSPRDS